MAKLIKSKIENLTPDDHNFNKGSEYGNHLIEKSFREFGAGRSILIDRNNRIIAGNKSIEAASSIGMENVVIVETTGDEIVAVKRTDIDLDSKKGRELALADNATNKANLDFDEEEISKLSEQFEFDASDWGIDLGIDVDVEEAELSEDEKRNIEKRCNLGDVWKLGRHRLICGDSTDTETYQRLMEGVKADITITSPPYNVGTDTSGETKYLNSTDSLADLDNLNLLCDFTKNCIENSQYVFVNIQSLANNKIGIIDYLHRFKNYYADTMIWNKGGGAPARANNVLNSGYEYVHVFSEKATRAIGVKKFHGTISNVINIPPQRNNEYSDIHNATFPVEFAEFFCKNFADKTVLEPFGGTGTTLIVCEQLGQSCYTIELDPIYCDVIISRWEKLTGLKAELVESKTQEDGTM